MDVDELPQDDKDFIIEKAIEGWTADIIAYEHRKQSDFGGLRQETVQKFLDTDRAEELIDKKRRIQEKKAEISREDLIRELANQIQILRERSDELRNADNDEVGNDTTRNLLKAVRDLADMKDVLESKESGSADNVVNINKLEQNFDITETVGYLPAEDKNSVVEQLENDPEVEDYMIVRKDEVEEVVEK